MITYQYLLNIRYKNNINIIIFSIFLFICFILACALFTYDRYTTYGVVKNNIIAINSSANNSDAVIKGDYLLINNKKYIYKILTISDLQEEDYVNYQIFNIDIQANNFLENQVLTITFYYNKQRIIQKIINIIF